MYLIDIYYILCMVRYIEPYQCLALPMVQNGDVTGLNPTTPIFNPKSEARDTMRHLIFQLKKSLIGSVISSI